MIAAAIAALLQAVLALLVAFRVPLTPEQQQGLLGIVVPLFTLISAAIARRMVTPV